MELRPAENVIFSSMGITMFFNIITKRSGTLVLTDQRLIFTALLKKTVEVELNDIESFSFFKVTFFLPYGIRFKLRNGKVLEYSVQNRKKWADYLSTYLKQE